MTDPNYSQPNGLQPQVPKRFEIASYGKRATAFLIDSSLLVLVMMLIIKHFGLTDLDLEKYADSQAMQAAFIEKIMALSSGQRNFLVMSPYLTFFALHGYLLNQFGQTLGKRLIGIAIVSLDDQKPNFLQLIAQRYLPQWIAGSLPFVGPLLRLVDILFIFNNTQNACIHDKIARTKVIDLSQPINDTGNAANRQGILEV